MFVLFSPFLKVNKKLHNPAEFQATTQPISLRQASVWENKDGQLSGLLHMLRHTADGLAAEIVAKRHYVVENKKKNNLKTFDPRFLIFEFITGFLLRKRQYELVTDFLTSHSEGNSAVHQMIMGAGKTTVIGPLLALILADGNRLVTQVCPGPLLEMTRGEMRKKYSNIIKKRIYTLSFDRSSIDSNNVQRLQRLYEKLNNARSKRAIVCTTPEAIKSIMLKYIDFLQQVEAAPVLVRAPGAKIGSALSNKTKVKAKEYCEKSRMADVLRKIIRLFSQEEGGVALLDEVDLLLHPLKSELNFPIGEKTKLPESPRRWTLPMHLLDAIFYGTTNRISVPDFKPNSGTLDLLKEIQLVIQKGEKEYAVQANPHPILLNHNYYNKEIRNLMGQWAYVWLREQDEIKMGITHTTRTSRSGTSSAQSAAFMRKVSETNSTDQNNQSNQINQINQIHHYTTTTGFNTYQYLGCGCQNETTFVVGVGAIHCFV